MTRIVLFLMIFSSLASSLAANAGTAVGWAYADEPNATFQYLAPGYSSAGEGGQGAVVTPLASGEYEIAFVDIGSNDRTDVQVAANQTEGIPSTGYCMIASWERASQKRGALVFVNCYDATGVPANRIFTVVYQNRGKMFGSSSKGLAFLLADQPQAASYTPGRSYQYNSTGAVNTMTRNGMGSYTATLPGLTALGGHVQITAYGSTPARCKTSGWTSGDAGTAVDVLCFDASGAVADEMFTLEYALNEPLAPVPPVHGAYAWANKPTKNGPYRPSPAYAYNGFKGGKITVQRNGVGQYAVSAPGGVTNENDAVFVTAYGTSNVYCSTSNGPINAWLPMLVGCYDQNGNLTDAQFDATIVSAQAPN